MGSAALFSVVMFDSYRGGSDNTKGWHPEMNDIVDGNSPYASRLDKLPTKPGAVEGEDKCGESEQEQCADLGFFRFIGPKKLNVDEDQRHLISRYVQDAIRDAGYITSGESLTLLNKSRSLSGESEDEI